MMETIINQNMRLTKKANQSNHLIPFRLNTAAEKLWITFSYDPVDVEGMEARDLIKTALKQYVPKEEEKKWGNIDRYLPLKNLITLSLSYEQQYVGAHHCKNNRQHIIISSIRSDKGFLKKAVAKGLWELQLNAHCIATDHVNVYVKIEIER